MPKSKTKKEASLVKFSIRENRNLYERLRIYERKKAPQPNPTRIVAKSKALEILFKARKSIEKKKKLKKRFQLNVPQNFSLIDNCFEVLKTIFSFIDIISRCNQIGELSINYSKMRNYDLSAESLIDYIIKEYDKTTPKQITISGFYPKAPEAVRFVKGIGIINELEIDHERLPKGELDNLQIFKKNSRKYIERQVGVSKTYGDEVCMSLVAHVTNCLERIGRELTKHAKAQLIECISEVIDNVTEHSGANEWSISGYLDTNNQDMRCEISLLNFGKTIAETFKDLPKESFPIRQMSEYVTQHSNKFAIEDLITVFSLQGNVSSKNFRPEDTRGQGTVQLISFFQMLHNEICQLAKSDKKYNMAVYSGNTLIKFDTKYQLKHDGHRDIIAFNPENKLKDPPDTACVINTGKYFFPGTIITLRFNIPQSMLRKTPPCDTQ